MSDKHLIELGAECVAGDLILGRVVVGQYRNGQFILTPDGAEIDKNVVDVEVKEVKEAPKPRKKKADEPTPVEEPAPVDEDPLAGLDAQLNA